MLGKSACSVILIHGIGSTKSDWSEDFRKRLTDELGPNSNKVRFIDAYWGNIALSGQLSHIKLAAAPEDRGAVMENDMYNQTRQQLQLMLDAEVKPQPGPKGFGPSDAANWIKNEYEGYKKSLDDISNYRSRESFRTAVQHALHDALGEAEGNRAAVLLVSHSQGTIISYDVLRQAGGNYSHLRTWITMGSPLRKFYLPLFHWGRVPLGMPTKIRWLNLYDPKDFVGNELKGALAWNSPVPEDKAVDNVKNAGGAHHHWQNPDVVRKVADEIRNLLA
jgi:hypothetical protein